jgi:RNA polymerase sigma-70 factor (ECF subfamily)
MPAIPAFDTAELQAHIPRLRRYARALTGNREAADDLTQDALERAWSKRDLWQPAGDDRAGSLRGWLLAIMHNLFVNHVRRTRSTDSLDAMAEAGGPEPVAATYSDPAASDRLRDVQAAMAELAEEHRAVLMLVAVEQMTYAQAAAVLDVPIGTVMSRLSRARDRLRALMEGTGEAARLRRVK